MGSKHALHMSLLTRAEPSDLVPAPPSGCGRKKSTNGTLQLSFFAFSDLKEFQIIVEDFYIKKIDNFG